MCDIRVEASAIRPQNVGNLSVLLHRLAPRAGEIACPTRAPATPLLCRAPKRGRVLPPEPEPEGKTRITIRLDQDIVDRFFRMAEESGGATGYQTLINAALREYLDGKAPRLEDTLRRIIREELKSSAA